MELLNKKRNLMPDSATVNESRHSELEPLIKMCDTVSSLTNQSVFLTDYIRQSFPYVSPHHLFLCGYTREEVQESGYAFIKKIVPPEDYQMLVELIQTGWKFIHNSPEKQFRVSYDYHLRHKNGNRILVNQKVAPLLFANDGTPWVNLCILNYSARKEAGNVAFNFKNESLYYKYDFEKKKIIPYTPEKLTRREEEIMRLSIQGYSETGISEKLHLSVQTVRNHRRNIIKKLGVNSLSNAISEFNLAF
ncbi:MAG: LuxR C-terminal-related transcriptional regulator [Prevotellaceae bacterium]|jgi:DNA-binding CsgD family transcriptional regulator|nr:LuxR C-terminal-related transcriptional regulator [Prevotellaceae bacterium]